MSIGSTIAFLFVLLIASGTSVTEETNIVVAENSTAGNPVCCERPQQFVWRNKSDCDAASGKVTDYAACTPKREELVCCSNPNSRYKLMYTKAEKSQTPEGST